MSNKLSPGARFRNAARQNIEKKIQEGEITI